LLRGIQESDDEMTGLIVIFLLCMAWLLFDPRLGWFKISISRRRGK
jgi:hypothetical protein